MADPRLIWSEGDSPPPVDERNPLGPLERRVLNNWLENSQEYRAAYQKNPAAAKVIEQAVRLAVHEALVQELHLEADGMNRLEAQELTRPAMWTPPTMPSIPR